MARDPKRILTEAPLIMRGRAFNAFYGFDSEKKYKPLKDQLNEKKYPVSKTDASYRVINSWSEAGLLLGEEDRDNGWRKFSFLDLIWLEIIKELRAVGFGLEDLSRLKDCLFDNEYVEKSGDTTFFAFYTSHTQTEDVRLIVLADGKGTLAFTQEYQASLIARLVPTTHTVVNINNIFAKLTGNPEHASIKNPVAFPDKKELEIMEKIKTDNVSEIKLKIKNNEVSRISYEKLIDNPESALEIIKQLFKEGGHREITIYQQGNRGHQIKQVDKS